MIESFSCYRDALPILVKQSNLAFTFNDAADTPQRKIELCRQFGQPNARFERSRKDQFVVVTAGNLGMACQFRVRSRGQIG